MSGQSTIPVKNVINSIPSMITYILRYIGEVLLGVILVITFSGLLYGWGLFFAIATCQFIHDYLRIPADEEQNCDPDD